MTIDRDIMLDRPAETGRSSSRCQTEPMDVAHRTGADPLGQALHLLRMSGAFYCHSELTEPWGLTLPPLPGYMWFHVGRRRACCELEARRRRRCTRGDLALVTHGDGHVLRSEPGADAPDILAARARAGLRALRDRCATAAAARARG